MLSHKEIVDALMRDFSMTREKAEHVAELQGAPRSAVVPVLDRGPRMGGVKAVGKPVPDGSTAPHSGSVRFTLPWSALVADNARTQPVIRPVRGVDKAIVILKPEYLAARKKIQEIAGAAMPYPDPFTAALSLHAAVWVPDNRRHDTSNFAKGVHDALEGVVYDNDDRLSKTTWEKMGVDVDRPRADITIVPYAGV